MVSIIIGAARFMGLLSCILEPQVPPGATHIQPLQGCAV
jgi:hypothetical protein